VRDLDHLLTDARGHDTGRVRTSTGSCDRRALGEPWVRTSTGFWPSQTYTPTSWYSAQARTRLFTFSPGMATVPDQLASSLRPDALVTAAVL